MTHTTELRVRYAETDQMGVVYHANYLVWCEVARTDFMRALGTPYSEIERQGVSLAVVEASLRCYRPARYDDLIRVSTMVTDVRSRSVVFQYEILLADGARAVTAATTLASLAPAGRAVRMPDQLIAALREASVA